jgi:hypothetical protein
MFSDYAFLNYNIHYFSPECKRRGGKTQKVLAKSTGVHCAAIALAMPGYVRLRSWPRFGPGDIL